MTNSMEAFYKNDKLLYNKHNILENVTEVLAKNYFQ